MYFFEEIESVADIRLRQQPREANSVGERVVVVRTSPADDARLVADRSAAPRRTAAVALA